MSSHVRKALSHLACFAAKKDSVPFYEPILKMINFTLGVNRFGRKIVINVTVILKIL